MIVQVEQWAFGEGSIREVELTRKRDDLGEHLGGILAAVFTMGQNDFQAKETYSVSCGDVIRFDDQRFLVCGVGFHRLTTMEYELLKAMPMRSRSLYAMSVRDNLDS